MPIDNDQDLAAQSEETTQATETIQTADEGVSEIEAETSQTESAQPQDAVAVVEESAAPAPDATPAADETAIA